MRKNKFEQLIESIINENEDSAKKIFHEIVIEQSRKIYEDLQDDEMGGDDFGDDIEADHDVIDGDEEGGEEELGGDEFGGEEEVGGEEELGGDEDLEDRVMNLEDALDELKAEFDALMSAEEEEGHDFGGEEELDGDDEIAGDDFGGEEELGGDEEFDADEEVDEEFGESVYAEKKSDVETMREYVEKVAKPSMNTEGGEIAASGKSVPINKKSINISGKNDMGGTTANIVKGGSEQAADGKPTPKPSNAYTKGQKEQEGASSWENRPGANTKGYKDKKSAKTGETGVNDKSIEPGGKPGFKG